MIREIMVFLQSHGVGTARAVRIYKTYGDGAIETVRENPYRLALDIRGIGFKTADQVASQLGIESHSLMRAQAGIRHVLQELCDHGHCAVAQDKLTKASVELLDIPASIIENALQQELKEENVIADEINAERCIYPISLYIAETKAAERIKRLNVATPPWGDLDIDKAVPWVEEKTGLQFAASQRHAIETVLRNKLAIITGGPGVGKTTIVNGFLKIIRAKGVSVSLCIFQSFRPPIPMLTAH